MSLLDNVRRTLEQAATRAATRAGEAATTAREVGQNLSAQAQSQIAIKKLQLEHTKKLRDLGEKTYQWHQSGTMIVAGPVPSEIQQLCADLDTSSTLLRLEESKLEKSKRQAETRGKNLEEPDTYNVLPQTNTTSAATTNANTNGENDMDNISGTYASPAKTEKSTQKLSAEGVTMPGTGIITNPTPPVSDPESSPSALPNTPAPDANPSPIPSDDTPIPSPAPDGAGGLGGGTGVGVGTGIGTGIGGANIGGSGSIPGGTF